MNRNSVINPALEPIKGIIVFNTVDEMTTKAVALFKTLCCEILSNHLNRVTVKTSRSNLQSIKRRWLEKKQDSPISQELKACVSQIIIGGAAKQTLIR